MKKVLVGLIVISLALSASAFILIPKELTISKVTLIQANENTLYRYLSNEGKWKKWWPSKNTTSDKNGVYGYNGFAYSLSKALYHAVEVKMSNEGKVYAGRIVIVPMSTDSVAVKWESTFSTSSNPFSRILDYQEAKKIRKNMEVILDSLKVFNEHKENLYDYNIHRATITDTFLVATKITTNHFPSIKEVYDLVENLSQYIKRQGAKETNYPMLNVTTNDSIHYITMVAIPTDKRLKDSGSISFKQMIIYKDKTVVAEVKGGPEAIKKAYEELNVYMNDYILSPPVIHWESLITDRSKERDSTKWVTKIFMPIV
jgi:effector-binding domain-containing protein